MASSFLNAAVAIGRVTISERIEAGRRERRVLAGSPEPTWNSYGYGEPRTVF